MQIPTRIFATAALALAAVLGLVGCSIVSSSSPSQFYVLDAVLPQGQEPLYATGEAGAPTVAVTTARVAAYLDRPQITLRSDGNAVRLNEFIRWAEPLGDGLTRVLRTNMVTLLRTPDSALPWTRSHQRDFNLFVQIEDIHLADNGKVLQLRFSYRLNEGRGSRTVLAGEHSYSTVMPADAAAGGDALYRAIASLASAQIGEFSVDIARKIAALAKENKETAAAQVGAE